MIPCRATGVERSWEYLKTEFERQSDGLSDPMAKYYETIGPGPTLFAVVGNSVYYHHEERWIEYRSAYDIEHGIIEVPE